jgi:hypothetical protein
MGPETDVWRFAEVMFIFRTLPFFRCAGLCRNSNSPRTFESERPRSFPSNLLNSRLTYLLLALTVLAGSLTLSGCGGLQASGKSTDGTPSASAGSFSANPTSVQFGNVNVGNTGTSQISLVNSSSSDVVITAIKASASEFSADGEGTLPVTLAAGATIHLNVHFIPTLQGAATGVLTISSNSLISSSVPIQLSGSGLPSLGPALSALSCTNNAVSGAATDACTVTLVAAAPSGGVAVGLSSNNLAVTVPSSVTVAANASTASFTATVAPVNIDETATLTSSANGGNQTFAIKLSPEVAGGSGNPTLTSLNCTSGTITGSGTDSCTVSLSGDAPSGGVPISLSSSNSAVTVPSSVTVAANASTATFTATIASVTSAETVTLTSAANGVDETFALKLNPQVAGSSGTPTLTVNAGSVSFGNVAVGIPATQSITLSSTGTAAVTVNGITLSGSGFTDSGVTLPLTLNVGQSATLNVQFAPTATGAATGNLTISSNSSTKSSDVVSLTGTGIALEIALNWDAPSGTTVSGYNVYRATGSSSSFQKLNSSLNAPASYTDATIQANTTYEYYVTSVDSSGTESAPSNTATVVVP